VLAGAAWAALSLAPFGFVGLVPANGRYAYLAVAGVLLAIVALAAAATERWRRAGTLVMVGALGVVALDWAVLLRGHLDAHGRASDLVAEVRREVARVAESSPPEVTILVEDHPHFVSTATGAPVAKVLQYGLSESILPPFGSSARAVVPLPAIVAAPARAALGALAGTARYRWNDAARRLDPIAEEGGTRGDAGARSSAHVVGTKPPRIEVDTSMAASGLLAATCSDCEAVRLVVVTAPFPFAAPPASSTGGRATFAVPDRFLRGVARQQQGPAFFWIEERRGEDVVAMSDVARFSLDADAPLSFARAAAKIARRGAAWSGRSGSERSGSGRSGSGGDPAPLAD
jgi:hypothetical protein